MAKFLDNSGVAALWEKIKSYVDTADNSLQFQIDAIGEPFRLHDFNQTFSVSLPSVTADVANTEIPNVDITLSDDMAVNWAIAGLAKYEFYNGSTRINAIPVCSFSMSGQKTLRVRAMVAGSSSQTCTKVTGALLLKHR